MVRFVSWIAVVVTSLWVFSFPDFSSIVAFLAAFITAASIQIKANPPSDNLNEVTINNEEKSLETPLEADKEEIPEVNLVALLAERFLDVFVNHGVHINEIPRCIPTEYDITLKEISDTSKLIEKLTPEVIDWVCSTFNIRRDWLETGGDNIYKTNDYYKCEGGLLLLLKELRSKHYTSLKVTAYKSVEELDRSGERNQYVNLLIAIPAFTLGDKVILKYIPTSTLWDWGYWRARYQFKGISRVCDKKLGIHFCGRDLDEQTIERLSCGWIFPKKIIDENRTGYTWYPEDYTCGASATDCAKETIERDSVIEYIKKQRYEDILNG